MKPYLNNAPAEIPGGVPAARDELTASPAGLLPKYCSLCGWGNFLSLMGRFMVSGIVIISVPYHVSEEWY
jgi:hypothetical protein